MRFIPTPLPGLFEVESEAHVDERGSFRRSWCAREFAQAGVDFQPVQASLSGNVRRHTLRGLHFQLAPHAEQKLVRCVRGCIRDVVVDVREDSPTRWQHYAVELDATRGNALFVPRGFAHGFLTLEDNTSVEYLIDAVFEPTSARGLRWSDPQLGIAWPAAPQVISDRDAAWPLLGLTIAPRTMPPTSPLPCES